LDVARCVHVGRRIRSELQAVQTNVAAGLMILADSGAHADSSGIVKIQAALDAWLADGGSAEKVTGVAAYVSFGDTGPAIEAFAGKMGSGPQDAALLASCPSMTRLANGFRNIRRGRM
jgi:hypothetical protein